MVAVVGRWRAGERTGEANVVLHIAGLVHLDVGARLVEETRAEHLLLLLACQWIGPADERQEVALVLVDGASLPEMV